MHKAGKFPDVPKVVVPGRQLHLKPGDLGEWEGLVQEFLGEGNE